MTDLPTDLSTRLESPREAMFRGLVLLLIFIFTDLFISTVRLHELFPLTLASFGADL
jgi:hypothetical protein